MSSVLYMGWLILDNIDGKQARRTNTSSPLGLMFDHQVDALNVSITTTFLANTLMSPSNALIYWFSGALPFYFTTWEETYTGTLDFTYFSAASDGCVIIGGLCFVFYILTPEYFANNTALGIEYRNLLLISAVIVGATVSISK
jgi:phosphatidylglycerophosphate synthase